MIHTLIWATLLGGGIVVLGAGYALFHALGRLRNSRTLILISIACYLALALAVIALTLVLELTEWWLGLTCALLVGYFVVPRFIWRLSVAVHTDISDNPLAKRNSHVG